MKQTMEIEEKETTFDKGDTPPPEGGCWFCHRMTEAMQFDPEFDTYYHPKCLDKTGYDSILEYEIKT